jgi:hypothetical protein
MAESKIKENNFDLIGYCSLYCPDCPLYLGKISDISRNLRKELRRVKYDKFAQYISQFPLGKQFKNFKECYDVLGAIMKFRCENSCRQGGGTEDCQIRQCCRDKNLEGCWQCNKFENCTKLDALTALHGNSHLKNIQTIRKKGISEFNKSNRKW